MTLCNILICTLYLFHFFIPFYPVGFTEICGVHILLNCTTRDEKCLTYLIQKSLLKYLPLPCLHHRVTLVMRLSRGCSEVIQAGKKSQSCSLMGKQSGLRTWRMFTVATNIITIMAGMPIPAITLQPAMERANTRDGSSRKQTSR